MPPIPTPILTSAIQSGSSLIGQGINAAVVSGQNKQTRRWNEKMYAQQRADALADWQMQNQYDHPSSQMARLREAGLNPNLVYGTGSVGNSSGQVRNTEVKSWNPTPPQFDLGDTAATGIRAFYDTQVKQATIDNLRTQNTVMQQDALLKAAQVIATGQSTDSAAFDLQLKKELKDVSVEAAISNVRKTQADTKSTLDENDRRAMLQATTLQQAIENILTSRMNRSVSVEQKNKIRAEIENLKKDTKLKELDIDLRKLGIQPGDSMFSRIIARLLGSGVEPGTFTRDMPWSKDFDSATFMKKYFPKK